jgi:hypothetical protein
MAEFGRQATQLSDPQGSGTGPIAAVQEQASTISLMPAIGSLVDLFGKGLAESNKASAEARKNAVIEEYTKNELVYADAMTTGSWNSAQVGTASRANYSKFIASNPALGEDLSKARSRIYGGTEVGEAQKKEDAAFAQREKDKAGAASMGLPVYAGMSPKAEDAQLEAYYTTLRVNEQTRKDLQASSERRAVAAEGRAVVSQAMSVEDHVAKKRSLDGLLAVGSANFDSTAALGQDLQAQMAKGMPYETAFAKFKANKSRIDAAMLSVSSSNPDLAAPWIKMFADMNSTIEQMLDPKVKSADESSSLKNKFDSLVARQKIMSVENNPDILKAVADTQLFGPEAFVAMSNSSVIQTYLASTAKGSPAPQVVGTKDDKQLFSLTKNALNKLNQGKVENKEKATVEAATLVNSLLKQTAGMQGEFSPNALNQASTFFSSSEFGKWSAEGKADPVSVANAQKVFMQNYDPAVKKAVIGVLDTQQPNGTKIGDSVKIEMKGNKIVFSNTPTAAPVQQGRGTGFGINPQENKEQLNKASDGITQLVRMHAHLEGTTDYPKYWEANKHLILPSVFPDPSRLKAGDIHKGQDGKKYKYIGGNMNDLKNSWMLIKEE